MPDTPAQLLERLAQATEETYPLAIIEEMIARSDEMIPHWLAVLDDVMARPDAYTDDSDMQWLCAVFSVYLLAQFRVGAALEPLLKILEQPGEMAFEVFSDFVTEDLCDALASVCHGRHELLCQLIENPQANEYVRSAALRSLLGLLKEGELTRDWVQDYFGQLMEHKLERETSVVWDNVTTYCGDCGFVELLPQVRQAFADDLSDDNFNTLDAIEEDAQQGSEGRWHEYGFISDTIASTQGWACFSTMEELEQRDEQLRQKYLDEHPEVAQAMERLLAGKPLFQPVARPLKPSPPLAAPPQKPAAGRNDPCPCGSGKKFKKCCGSVA